MYKETESEQEKKKKRECDKANVDKRNLNKEYMSFVLFYACKFV